MPYALSRANKDGLHSEDLHFYFFLPISLLQKFSKLNFKKQIPHMFGRFLG
jgi:hypothetical protein